MWVMTEEGELVNLDRVVRICVEDAFGKFPARVFCESENLSRLLMSLGFGDEETENAKRCVVGIAKCIGVAAKANWDGVLDLRLGTADRELVMKGGENG